LLLAERIMPPLSSHSLGKRDAWMERTALSTRDPYPLAAVACDKQHR